MDLGEEDKFDLENRNGDPLNCHSSNVSQDWKFSAANHSNQSIGLVPMNNSIATSTSNIVATEKGVPGSSRTCGGEALDLGWNPPKGNGFLQTIGEIMPQTLSEFPADPAFIERAARFSCFSGGSFSDMVNPYKISESMNPYSRDGIAIQGPFEVLSANGLGVQSQINEQNMTESPRDVVSSIERGVAEGRSSKEKEVVGYVRTHDETSKECNVTYEAEVSGSGRQVEPSMLQAGGLPSASKGHSMKKRKRTGQVTEMDRIEGAPQLQCEAAKDNNEPKQKNGQNPTTTGKATKHCKDSSQNSDAAKEDYIHVRARRGQATNSHSLAERVRREKISERMKFLQDLVPGCNKVTGKAVMLDEIINYVQSLQRQVEFLSMKLATVNPGLDLNVEGLLAKDIHQSRGGPSMLPFSQDAIHAQLHPSQQGLIRSGIPGTGNPLDALRRPFSSQLMAMNGGGYKDSSQIPNMWDDELNNVFPINFDVNSPFIGQDENDSHPSGHMKVEL